MGSIHIAADDKRLIVCLPLFVDCIVERHFVLKPLLAPFSVWEIDIEQGKRVESHDKNASLCIKSSMKACRNLHRLVARIYTHSAKPFFCAVRTPFTFQPTIFVAFKPFKIYTAMTTCRHSISLTSVAGVRALHLFFSADADKVPIQIVNDKIG